MPMVDARYFIHINKVEIQPLQDLRPQAAVSEGIDRNQDFPVLAFAQLWNKIEKSPFRFEDNPYVFVYHFATVKKLGWSSNSNIGKGLYLSFDFGKKTGIWNWDDEKKKLVKSDLPF